MEDQEQQEETPEEEAANNGYSLKQILLQGRINPKICS